METVTTWIRAILTAGLLLLALWWLSVIAGVIPSVPSKTADGLVVDQFQRAKDILAIVIPLLSAALGYWFGVAGKANAESTARNAQGKLAAVLDASDTPGLLNTAKDKHPELFNGSVTVK